MLQRGAIVNKDKSRSLDTETGSTGITALNIWDAQFRNNTGKVGTWSISLGEDCDITSS